MPPLALANNNWIGPAPEELSQLTETELLFVARGFSHMTLRQLRSTGDPRTRQRGLLGGTVAFPQDGSLLLDLLPHHPSQIAEYFSVIFSKEDFDDVRVHRALLVRRSYVHAALRWLKIHNQCYVDIIISTDNLAALPESAVPGVLLQAFSDSQAAAHQEQGWLAGCVCVCLYVYMYLCMCLYVFSSCRCLCRCLHPRPSLLYADASPFSPGLPGPADAVADPQNQEALLNAACLNMANASDSSFALNAWESLSVAATQMSSCLERQPSDVLAAALHAASACQAFEHLTSGQAAADMTRAHRSGSDTTDSHMDEVGIVPHSGVPLNSYDPSFWPICHPLHFPYGIGGHGASRLAPLSDEQWCRHLLLRGDRRGETAWCRSLSLIAVLFNTIHRRRLLRAIRIRLSSPSWTATVKKLNALRSADFMDIYNLLGDNSDSDGGCNISRDMKELLRALRIVQSTVPGTEGARFDIRRQLTALHFWHGFPAPWRDSGIAVPLILGSAPVLSHASSAI